MTWSGSSLLGRFSPLAGKPELGHHHLKWNSHRWLIFFFFLDVPTACGSFWGKGSNLSHSSTLSHYSDNAGSLTHCTRELWWQIIFIWSLSSGRDSIYCWHKHWLWVTHLTLFIMQQGHFPWQICLIWIEAELPLDKLLVKAYYLALISPR